LRGGVAQQLGKMFLPYRGNSVRAVAARLRSHRDREGAAARHALDLALQNAELRRIDEVVGEVDRDERRADLLQSRCGIVVARRFQLVQQIIRVSAAH
jgi:hypothetical protein